MRRTAAVLAVTCGLGLALPASAASPWPLRTRDAALFRAAFSGVPGAGCASTKWVIVCGDHATYFVDMKRVQRCLVKVTSGRYAGNPTRVRYVRGCV
jgi:hypothetical protein